MPPYGFKAVRRLCTRSCASNHGFTVFRHMLIISIAFTCCFRCLVCLCPLNTSIQPPRLTFDWQPCVAPPRVLCDLANPHVFWPKTRPQRRRQCRGPPVPMTMSRRRQQGLSGDNRPHHQFPGPSVDGKAPASMMMMS